MKFLVEVQEVHKQLVEIEANTPGEAKSKVHDGEGDYAEHMEYSRTLDQDTWTVTEVNNA